VKRAVLAGALLLWACAGERAPEAPALPPVPWSSAPDLELDLRAWQSADKVALLAPLTVVVDLYCGPGIECEFTPHVPTGFVGAVKDTPFAPLGAGRARRFVLSLQPTQLGDVEIAPFRAEAKTKADAGAAPPAPVVATTPAVKVTVESVLGTHGEAIEAPAPPFAPRFDPWPWLIGAGVVALLVVLVLWWRKRPRRARQAALETRLPPHVTALRALARLRSASRATAAEVDAFYVEVSRILRRYLEERFGLHAPERTTEEFLAELNQQGTASPLDGRQRNALADFLRQCDLVKFARVLPGEDVHGQSLRIAEELVEATRGDRVLQEAAS
jgi:hypothetical protein